MILREKFQNFSIFALIHTSISLNQGQGSIFTLRECAQSIFRLEITLKSRFFIRKSEKICLKKNHVGGPPPDVDELRIFQTFRPQMSVRKYPTAKIFHFSRRGMAPGLLA